MTIAKTLIFMLISVVIQKSFGDTEVVIGRNFTVPATQQIYFVDLEPTDSSDFSNPSLPKKVDLRPIQSSVKSQGQRGACTYFTVTSLVESLFKKSTGQELDLSEEHLAWAAKTQKKLRSFEEDSSVAVNAATIQDFGFMLEEDLPYQQSWFDHGFPCEGQKGKPNIDPICFSHAGPSANQNEKIFSGKRLEFQTVDSSSLDIVHSLASLQNPVTISILAHPETWEKSVKTGHLFLTERLKRECQKKLKPCSGHAALIVGYDLEKRIFYFKNSWGTDWGIDGYGTIPFDYIDQMSKRKLITGRLLTNEL